MALRRNSRIQLKPLMGNWNFEPRPPRPDLTPAPFGIPFSSAPPRDGHHAPAWRETIPAPFGIPFGRPNPPGPPRFPADE